MKIYNKNYTNDDICHRTGLQFKYIGFHMRYIQRKLRYILTTDMNVIKFNLFQILVYCNVP